MAATPDGALIINTAPTGNELVEMWRGNMRVAYPISSLQPGYPASTVSGVTPSGALICKGSPNGEEVITTWVNGNTQVAYRLRTLSGNPPSLTGRYTTPDGVTIINTLPSGNELVEAWSGNTPVAFREGLAILSGLLFTGPLTYNTTSTAGTLVANISGVPSGRTPTLLPADGRMVIAGDEATGWKVVKGLVTSTPGTIFITVSATGTTSATQNVSVVDTNAPTFDALKAAAPQVLVVSNVASNGYGLGNDTTGNGTAAAPYLTWDKACSVGVDGCFIEVNPTATPYQESTAGAGYLRPSASKAFVWAANPAFGKATIQCTGAATRVILLDASAKTRTFFGIILDGTGTSSGNIISTGGAQTGGSFFYNCIARNSTGSVYQKPTGTLNILTVVNCAIESTCHFMVSATGGNWTSQTWQGNTFTNDNQVYKGAAGGTIDTFECTGNAFVGHPSGTGTGFNFSGDTIGTINFTGNSGTGTFASALLTLSASTVVTGLIQVKLNTGSPSAGTYLCNAEAVTSQEIDDNNLSMLAAFTQDQLVVRAATGPLKGRRNMIATAATSQTHGIAFGGDGYNLNVTNTGATATVNLGDTSAHKYMYLKFTTGANTAALSSWLGCFLLKFKKQLSPDGSVTAALYTDNAGVPGTLVETASNPPTSASLPSTGTGLTVPSTGFQWLTSHSKTSFSTVYYLVLNYTGTIDGTNYLTLVSNATVTSSNIGYSADGITWTPDATKSLWFQLDCGSFGCTLDLTDTTVTGAPTASATTHGILVGALNIGTVARLYYVGPGIGHLFKNTNGATGYVYDLLAHCFSGSQSAVYLKGAIGMRVYQFTAVQTSTTSNLASAVLVGSNSECGVNAPISNPQLLNYIAVNTGIGAVFSVDVGGVPGMTSDYGCVYAGASSFGIERNAFTTWGAWQGAGKDAHSVNANPQLAVAPASVADFIPPSSSPAVGIGTNLQANAPADFLNVAFSTTPPAGGLNPSA